MSASLSVLVGPNQYMGSQALQPRADCRTGAPPLPLSVASFCGWEWNRAKVVAFPHSHLHEIVLLFTRPCHTLTASPLFGLAPYAREAIPASSSVSCKNAIEVLSGNSQSSHIQLRCGPLSPSGPRGIRRIEAETASEGSGVGGYAACG